MDRVVYSEKEIAIFNGVINLLKEGRNPYQVKVADIANSAGVGKGTIYEYFGNKKEVIKKALLYNLNQEISALEERLRSKVSFKDQYYEVLASVRENIENKFSTFNILLSVGKISDINLSQLERDLSQMGYFHRMAELLERMLTAGNQEGLIKKIEDGYYAHMVLKSSFYMFGEYISLPWIYKDISRESAMEYAYEMVLKSLR